VEVLECLKFFSTNFGWGSEGSCWKQLFRLLIVREHSDWLASGTYGTGVALINFGDIKVGSNRFQL